MNDLSYEIKLILLRFMGGKEMGKLSSLFQKSSKKPDTKVVEKETKVDENLNYWICSKCGTQNSKSSLSCKDCGKYK